MGLTSWFLFFSSLDGKCSLSYSIVVLNKSFCLENLVLFIKVNSFQRKVYGLTYQFLVGIEKVDVVRWRELNI